MNSVRGNDKPGLGESFGRCQYRLFFDGETFTFREGEPFLGGVVWFWEYQELGLTRAQAIADIEKSNDRVWFARVLPGGGVGEFVEQPLVRTGYKSFATEFVPLNVYQQRAFITQLPAGEYVSLWKSTHPDYPPLTATVHLVILPS